MPVVLSPWDSGDPGGGGGRGGIGLNQPTDAMAREFGTMLQVVSEGPIQGLVDGLKSVFLDGTPVRNAVDVGGLPSYNFKGIAFALVAGTNTQAMIPGFTDAESETSVNVKVAVSTGAITRTISTAGISAIRVRVAIPSLKVINATTGAESGAAVRIQIERQSASYNAGAWEIMTLEGDGLIAGKFGSKYTKSFRIETPAAGPWSIRVTRLTADHTSGAPDYTQDETWWDAYTEITDAKLRYPYSAVAALKVDAKQFQNIPQLTLDIKGRLIQVPSNYNPTTRVYTGIWDGTFITAWTDNPAWVWYDMASHTRYGSGTVLAASKLDKWALYAIAQQCDVLVSDGKGGMEPRFRCNLYLQNQEDAIKLLRDMASIFRGMVYAGSGLITAVQDQDASPVAVFTNSNVKDGRFNYQGSARKSRHTAALVTWQDPANGYQNSVEYVEDQAAIARYGYNPIQTAALGATSQAQAHRQGLWTILSETMNTEVINFTSGLEGITLRPGDIFATRDQFRAGDGRLGGRILAGATTTVIPLDAPVVLPAGTNTLTVKLADGTVASSTVTTAAGTVSSLTVSPALPAAPPALSQWALNVALYRALSIKKGDGIYYDITGLEHTPSKYALVDGVTVTPGPSTPASLFQAPSALTLADVVRIEKDKLVQSLTANWTGDATAIHYAEASQDYGEWQPMKVNALSASLDGITAGAWRVRVQALYPGGVSPWTTGTRTVATPTQTATDAAAAAAAAAAAQASANAALADIANIVSDNVLSKGEKSAVIQDWSVLSSEQAGIDAQATAYSVSHAAYDSALSSLSTYLGGLSPAWNDTTQDTPIVGTTFRTNWENAYTAKTSLLNAIYAAAKTLADNAQSTANTASTNASAALTKISDASADGIITDLERPGLKTLRATLALAVSAAQTQANGMSVGHSTLDTAWSTFTANVDPVLAATGNSAITKATWDGWWSTVYQEVQNLQGVLSTTANNAAAYANTLARSSFNLVKNAGTDNTTPPAGSYEAAGLWQIETTPGALYSAMSGSGYARVAQLGAGGGTVYVVITPVIPCVPGDQFYIRGLGTGPSNGGAPFIIAKTTGPGGAYNNFMSNTASGTLTAPTTLEMSVTVPTGHTGIQLVITLDTGGANSYAFFNRFYMTKKVSAGMLEADLAIVGVVRSPNYVAGAYGSAPVGFKQSGYAFTTTYIDGTSNANCFFELQGAANFGGWQVDTVNTRNMTAYNRILNGHFYKNLHNWTVDPNGTAVNWNASSASAGTGSATVTGVTSSYDLTGSLYQCFNLPPSPSSAVINLTLNTALVTNDSSGSTCSVTAYLLDQSTGTETALATWSYSAAAQTLVWTARSVNITSYVSGGGDFSLRLDMRVTNTAGVARSTTIYVDSVKIVA